MIISKRISYKSSLVAHPEKSRKILLRAGLGSGKFESREGWVSPSLPFVNGSGSRSAGNDGVD